MRKDPARPTPPGPTPPTATRPSRAELTGPDLVEAARSGDPGARAALFGEYLPLVYNVVGRGLQGHTDVDDVVQETMLRAMRALPLLREPERFRSWIVSIAIRQMQEQGRRSSAALARHRPVTDADGIPDGTRAFADVALDRRALAEAGGDLLEAGRWLSDEERRTMALWWQETAGQLTRAEVAEALDLSAPHTAVRIQRMKARLSVAVGVLAAWRADPRCAGLDAVAAGGRRAGRSRTAAEASGVAEAPTAAGGRLLTRLDRHVQDCPRCGAAATWNSVDDLPIRIGALAVPAALGATVAGLAARHGAAGGPVSSLLGSFRHALGRIPVKAAVTAAGATVTLAVVTGVTIHHLPPGSDAPGTVRSPAATNGTPHLPGAVPSARTEPSSTPKTSPAAYSGLATADYYVAPDGDDTGPGTLARPFATVTRAVSRARPGQTVAVRGGTYHPGTTVSLTASGTRGHRITVSNYRDERPVFDGSRLPSGAGLFVRSGGYVTVQGLEIEGVAGRPFVCTSCHDDVLARLVVHGNGSTGLLLQGAGTHDNLIQDSDFYDNHESGSSGGYVDGVGFTTGAGAGNRIRGCRIYDNSGDGLDLSGFDGSVTIDHTWAFGNGVNRWGVTDFSAGGSGFKLGGDAGLKVAPVVSDSAAWDNAGFGFTETGSAGTPRLTDDTAYRNGAAGFAFVTSAAVLRRDLALGNRPDVWLGTRAGHTGNSWDQRGWTTAALHLTGTTSPTADRDPDGRLPSTLFLGNTRDPSIGARLTP
ncbi:sigma-70 family RNA polymerase sigma factor [Streptomyces sp. NPDC048278]|uniref:sigma-70 family RNA polymerase sigma factor n=1 Tax=Streptomyces sp. NPDC048278 TaxID=3155809 RepID=UPI0034392914